MHALTGPRPLAALGLMDPAQLSALLGTGRRHHRHVLRAGRNGGTSPIAQTLCLRQDDVGCPSVDAVERHTQPNGDCTKLHAVIATESPRLRTFPLHSRCHRFEWLPQPCIGSRRNRA
jgi:hypothetical protein